MEPNTSETKRGLHEPTNMLVSNLHEVQGRCMNQRSLNGGKPIICNVWHSIAGLGLSSYRLTEVLKTSYDTDTFAKCSHVRLVCIDKQAKVTLKSPLIPFERLCTSPLSIHTSMQARSPGSYPERVSLHGHRKRLGWPGWDRNGPAYIHATGPTMCIYACFASHLVILLLGIEVFFQSELCTLAWI